MRRHPQVLIAKLRARGRRFPRLAASGNGSRPVAWDFRRAALAGVLAGLLASCSTADDPGSRKAQPPPEVGAQLRQTNDSAIRGLATFQQSEGGLKVAVTLLAFAHGQWQVVIHTTGNCTSPNGFSAGPPMLLPGATEPPKVPVFTNADGTGGTSLFLPGLTIDGPAGVRGKSVVVHQGIAGSLEAQPGVRNNRVACGVIDTLKPIL